MRSLLFHGTSFGKEILRSKRLLCNSFPEYSFSVNSNVLSLSRSFEFSRYYALLEREHTTENLVFVLDRDVLKTRYKIRTARSTIFDDCKYEIDRSECEEFLVEPVPVVSEFILGVIPVNELDGLNNHKVNRMFHSADTGKLK